MRNELTNDKQIQKGEDLSSSIHRRQRTGWIIYYYENVNIMIIMKKVIAFGTLNIE